MLKDRHFTVNGCQIVNFCDTVEHFFEKIALKIKKYQFFYKFFNKRHVNISKIKISKITKQGNRQLPFFFFFNQLPDNRQFFIKKTFL